MFSSRAHIGREPLIKVVGEDWLSRYSFQYDGVAEYFNIDHIQSALSTATEGCCHIWIKPDDATPASNQQLITFGDTDAPMLIYLQMQSTGILNFTGYIAGTAKWRVLTNAQAFTSGIWSLFSFSQTADAAAPQIFIDGVKPAQTNSISTDNSVWFNDIAGLDNGRIGCNNFNSGGNAQFFAGKLTKPIFENKACTLADHVDIYNNGKPKDESSRPNIVAYLNEERSTWGTQWTYKDVSGNLHNGTSVQMEGTDRSTDVP